ncbi:MAG: 30S ribosomal protein S3 [Thaumarchaeota archaeon]|nr:30S ribosomal protein S3 [Nitrososphaerota archaeon]
MSAVKNVIKDNYNMMLLVDYLKNKIKDAGFSHAEISKTPTGTRVALHVTRPGIVVGRKGVGIRELTEILGEKFELKNVQISVNEVSKPELVPSVMCTRMASHIERGTAFRRATMWTMQSIMDSGAMGVQITISGKLRGDRSAFEKHTAGILPRAGHHADVIVTDDIAHVKTPMGLIGIKIRIARKEKFVPEFELKKEQEKILETEQTVDSETEKLSDETEKEHKPSTETEQTVDSETEKLSDETEKEHKPSTETEQTVDSETEKLSDETKEKEHKPSTETEQILIEEEKMKKLETLEEEEEELK